MMELDDRSEGTAVPPPVCCRSCAAVVGGEDAQALRWLYWAVEREREFPLCEPCARERFGGADTAPVRTSAST